MFRNPMKIKGLTLIELMITLAIAGVLIATAAPNMREFIQNNRSATQINELQATLSLARSEAIKRNTGITVCRSSNGTSCAGNWQDGWIIFVDSNFDGAVDADTDPLRVHGGLVAGNTLRFTQARISYANTGLARTGSNGIFIHCDSRGAENARGILVGPSGRARVFTESDFSDVIEDHPILERFVCA
jgi:type IV fimbrial biogenesis protein FimT